MSDDKILSFNSVRSPIEVIINEAEADNISYMGVVMSTNDGDFYVMELGEELDFLALSYFAKYFEDMRQEYLNSLGEENEF